jgi:hypothetical protein
MAAHLARNSVTCLRHARAFNLSGKIVLRRIIAVSASERR